MRNNFLIQYQYTVYSPSGPIIRQSWHR